MTTITAGVVTPVSGAYGTTPAYSGTFIPTIWSAKLNAKFYTASTFADICNRDWEGDIANVGDKVIINNIPSLVINDYVVGGNLSYQTPTPSTLELTVDRAKYFGFNVNDVMEYQSKPDLMSMFTDDASEQMRVVVDSTCLYRTLLDTTSIAAANQGATAGAKSASYNLGTDTVPVDLSSATTGPDDTLALILRMASTLDEQNIPNSGRWLLLDPATRMKLMNSKLAQAYLTGDATSMLRNGLIGSIDRFKVYVTNHLPYKAISGTVWVSGDGSESSITGSSDTTRNRVIAAGHTSGISFASQMVKTEQLRNPTDFGDLVRGLQVFGHKVTKGEAVVLAMVTG
jgi:hypothetical protein